MAVMKFIRESVKEMKENVTWLPFSSVQEQSLLVLVASTVFALVVYGVDIVTRATLENIYALF
ncbi:preprotein translocase subunit SecE [Sediminitomix flava]|uniref:Preprotein translocase subunit SecE n=1 Tax=Sediminitomix flava TaxID=379075 RepID=A0A315ZIE3_SEDFL|nr:preprotein translocase subunit SecE [Sediminitomix flava]PWJ44983.1 preprotein translocase subunit SecE [Sediminitomix flava]